MLELEDAVARIQATIPAVAAEQVSLAEAQGRVLVQEALSNVDIPPFDNSAMDGYAVRAEDVKAAKPEAPVTLRLMGRVAAGETFSQALVAGSCIRLFTGSPLPAGSDAVVMQEDVQVSADRPEEIRFLCSAAPWENTRLRGEDIRKGTNIVAAGQKLGPGKIGVLAAAGIREVSVGRRPLVGLLATGNELREPGTELRLGEIYESNRLALAALARDAGAIPKILPLVPDELEATSKALSAAFDQCDVLVTSGGVSVGEMDFVKSAFEAIGGDLQFWKVSIRPGRPFVFGRSRGKYLFGLPGNPVSALVTFLLLVRPALLRWQGAVDCQLPRQTCKLGEPMTNRGDRRHFMRVRVDENGTACSAGIQASHMLSSVVAANGLLDLAPQASLPAGAVVQVLRWD